MGLDASRQQAVESCQAVGRVLADHAAAQLRLARVQAHPQGADVLLDDAGLIFRLQVRERDEGSRKEAQAEVVVAQHERGAHAVGQLAHEAEHAGVAAELHGIEQHAVELEAPPLPRFALQLHHPGLAVEVDVADRDVVVGRKPAPVDDVAQGRAIHGREVAAGRKAGIVGGAFRLHGDNARRRPLPRRGRRLGSRETRLVAGGARGARGLALDVFSGVGGHGYRARRNASTAAIWFSGVLAPAVTPTRRQSAKASGSSSSVDSMWKVRGQVSAHTSASRVVFDE